MCLEHCFGSFGGLQLLLAATQLLGQTHCGTLSLLSSLARLPLFLGERAESPNDHTVGARHQLEPRCVLAAGRSMAGVLLGLLLLLLVLLGSLPLETNKEFCAERGRLRGRGAALEPPGQLFGPRLHGLYLLRRRALLGLGQHRRKRSCCDAQVFFEVALGEQARKLIHVAGVQGQRFLEGIHAVESTHILLATLLPRSSPELYVFCDYAPPETEPEMA